MGDSGRPALVFGEGGGDAGEEIDFGELLDAAAFLGDQGEAETVLVLVEVGALFDTGLLELIGELRVGSCWWRIGTGENVTAAVGDADVFFPAANIGDERDNQYTAQ